MFNLFRSAFGASQTLSNNGRGSAAAAAAAVAAATATAAPLEKITSERANALQHAIAMLDGPLRAREKKGIYRVCGDKMIVDELAEELLLGSLVKPDASGVVALAEALKRCLRDLQPLVPYAYYDQFLRCVTFEGGKGTRAEVDVAELRDLLLSIPRVNRALLRSLLSHLRSVALNERVNKMGASNLALTCGLHILRPASEDPLQLLRDSSRRQALLVHLIENGTDGGRGEEGEQGRQGGEGEGELDDDNDDDNDGDRDGDGDGDGDNDDNDREEKRRVEEDDFDYYGEEKPGLAAPLSPTAAAAAAAGARRRLREEQGRQGRRRGMRRDDRDRRAKSRGVRFGAEVLKSLGEAREAARKHTADARDILQASLSPSRSACGFLGEGSEGVRE